MRFAPALAVMLTTACAQDPAPAPGRTSTPIRGEAVREGAERPQSIVNGDLDVGDHAVVALVAFGHAFCSGTLVSQRLVLTAAHCIDPAETGGLMLSDVSVFFGDDLTTGGTSVKVQDGVMHPAYDNQTFANDIAMLLLVSPAPVDPVAMNTTHFDDTFIKRKVRLAGFGVTSGTAMATGTKRTAMSTVTQYEPLSFRYSTDPGQTCFGDSGGPGFLTIDGAEVLAGVTSNGDPDCTVYGNDTRVDEYVVDWVSPYLAANLGCGADGACTFGCTPSDPDCGAIGCTTCGNTLVGDFCETNADCKSGLCIGAIDDPTIKYCSQTCSGDLFCPAPIYGTKPLQCVPTNDGTIKVCAYQQPTPTAVGWACTTGDDCHAHMCITPPGVVGSKVCTRACKADGDADCPLAFDCLAPPGGGDAGLAEDWVCVPQLPGQGSSAATCAIRVAPGAAGGASVMILVGLALAARRRRR